MFQGAAAEAAEAPRTPFLAHCQQGLPVPGPAPPAPPRSQPGRHRPRHSPLLGTNTASVLDEDITAHRGKPKLLSSGKRVSPSPPPRKNPWRLQRHPQPRPACGLPLRRMFRERIGLPTACLLHSTCCPSTQMDASLLSSNVKPPRPARVPQLSPTPAQEAPRAEHGDSRAHQALASSPGKWGWHSVCRPRHCDGLGNPHGGGCGGRVELGPEAAGGSNFWFHQ